MAQIPSPVTGSGGGSDAPMFGLLAQPYSPYLVNDVALSATSGFALFTLVRPGAVTVTNLGVWVGTAAVTGTGTNAMALYSEAGVLIAQTGDMTTLLTGAASNTYVQAALSGGPRTLSAADNYYLGLLCHNTTAPKIGGYFQTTSVTVPALNSHYPSIQLSSQASFPASFTPSSATKNNAVYWLAAS